jgi:hypothetical protein
MDNRTVPIVVLPGGECDYSRQIWYTRTVTIHAG